MGRGKKYTEDYKEMISDLYKSGMTISEISSEYGIAKSTINGWVKANKEIKISEDEVITLKEMARIKEENEILKKAMAIFAKEN
ncbi:transposase [Clostridium perfringens]|uniref:transposase n=1 Tax=Clostridium perfringens TaxID=1502 RepID=UPI0013E37A67|nr:transposase [Clostridium perfringens]MDJ8930612.1 transposase [Clostridium perfringens]NGT40730.1 transposase [Clostridium perfringens]